MGRTTVCTVPLNPFKGNYRLLHSQARLNGVPGQRSIYEMSLVGFIPRPQRPEPVVVSTIFNCSLIFLRISWRKIGIHPTTILKNVELLAFSNKWNRRIFSEKRKNCFSFSYYHRNYLKLLSTALVMLSFTIQCFSMPSLNIFWRIRKNVNCWTKQKYWSVLC